MAEAGVFRVRGHELADILQASLLSKVRESCTVELFRLLVIGWIQHFPAGDREAGALGDLEAVREDNVGGGVTL